MKSATLTFIQQLTRTFLIGSLASLSFFAQAADKVEVMGISNAVESTEEAQPVLPPPPPKFAQPANGEDAIPNYTLEVIVFETFALKSWTEEYWPEEIEEPEIESAFSLQALLDGQQNSGDMQVKSQATELTDEAARLSPKKGYRILFHQAWSQNTAGDQEMPKISIEGAYGTTNVYGTVKLYKSRYAHVDFDLNLERRIPDRVMDEFIDHQKLVPTSENGNGENVPFVTPEYWAFKLKEARKIRPNQLHYLDHPQFGVLVQLRYNGPAEL